MTQNFMYLDIETLDFFQDPHIAKLPREEQIEAIRFGLAITIEPQESGDDIIKTWRDAGDLFHYLATSVRTVVGWNINDFDLPIIFANSIRRQDLKHLQLWAAMKTHDIFGNIRGISDRWYKLDVIARTNLGRGKTSHGQQATNWLRSGDEALIAKAAEYCIEDNRLVADLHKIMLHGGWLHLPPLDRDGQNYDLWYRNGVVADNPDWLTIEDFQPGEFFLWREELFLAIEPIGPINAVMVKDGTQGMFTDQRLHQQPSDNLPF